MNKETIEKAAKDYAEENVWYPGETSYESDIREMEEHFAAAFEADAYYVLNHLCSIPWNESFMILAKYAENKQDKEDEP